MDKNSELTVADATDHRDPAVTATVSHRELRYSAFVENAVEGIWRIDFDPPICMNAPKLQQVHQVFDRGVFMEANDATAHIYGLTKGVEVVGRPLADFMSLSVSKNRDMINELVQNRFTMRNLVSYEQNIQGETLCAVNNITPRIEDAKVQYVWGASLDISDLMRLQEKLENSRNELVLQKQALEEKNAALKELLTYIELNKKEYKERITANIEQLILPLLDKISSSHADEIRIEQLRQALHDLTSSFGSKIANRSVNLTPREIEVCALVKNGFSSKEIARKLEIALHTVEKHRRMARKKLGLARQGINLKVHLNSL